MLSATQQAAVSSYTPVGDIVVSAVCCIMLFMIGFSYIRKSAGFRVFMAILPCLMGAAFLNIIYHMLLNGQGAVPVVYVFRGLFYGMLFFIFVLFTLYICTVTRLDTKARNIALALSIAVLVGVVAADTVTAVSGLKQANSSGDALSGGHIIFFIGYTVSFILEVSLIFLVRRRLYKRVMMSFASAVALSLGMLILQSILGKTTSFTVSTFLFPVIAMFYIMHSHPYDAEMGTVSGSALKDIVRYNYEKKNHMIFISLQLSSFLREGQELPASLQALIRRFASDYFKGALLVQVNNGHMILLFQRDRNPDYEHRIEKVLKSFGDYRRVYQYNYKVVIGESVEEISRRNEYVSLIRSIHRNMKENTVHRVTPEDISNFDRSIYILSQLEDIHRKQDLKDPRVLVYCQPVYNLRESRYDTAEALMRLNLPETGIVLPDYFVHLAEEHGYIHTLTRIILHKTCEEIRSLLGGGYDLQRISINVSMIELRADQFCSDISSIISRNGVSGDRVAIELTESENENDFNVMRDKISELREKGVKFYLDDFGTGYSNMERIIKLPFDIIKFDRSLVVASGSSERSEKIVSNMANLFSDLNYSVLYEGVETDTDESLCREMSASYLQGFKYSRPIPISELRRFVSRKNAG